MDIIQITFSAEVQLVARADHICAEVFGEIGCLNCKPITFLLKSDAQPYSLATPHRVPFPRVKVDEELQQMQSMQIIRKFTQPTDCALQWSQLPRKMAKSEYQSQLVYLTSG